MRTLFAAFVAFASLAFPAAAQDLTFEPGVDRLGSDYHGFDIAADPQLCRSACAADGRCMAFTYVRPGVQGPSARCYLKNPAPAASPNDCCVSGVRADLANAGSGAHLATPNVIVPRAPNAELNPQPEPPAPSNVIVAPGDLTGLNPQPEPPTRTTDIVVPGTLTGLNPQPEPPTRATDIVVPGTLTGLNPQPEPPAEVNAEPPQR